MRPIDADSITARLGSPIDTSSRGDKNMTREEAIEILDPKTRDEALAEYDCRMRVLAKKEAARLAVSALRAQQTPAKLDRSRRKGCEVCCSESCEICRHDGDFYSCTSYFRCTCEEYEPLKFCPNCGRPLTEEAWAELERRINGGTTDLLE